MKIALAIAAGVAASLAFLGWMVVRQSSRMVWAEDVPGNAPRPLSLPIPAGARHACYCVRGLHANYEYDTDEKSLREFLTSGYPSLSVAEVAKPASIRTYRACLFELGLRAAYFPPGAVFADGQAVVKNGLAGSEIDPRNGGGVGFVFDRDAQRVFWAIWPR